MPETEEKLEEKKVEDIKPPAAKSKFNTKILLFGIPVFMLQLILVYFITANILIKKIESHDGITPDKNVKNTKVKNTKEKSPVVLGKYIYSISDLIVNPADTDGKRLLLTTVGFDIPTADMETELKTREAMVKDVVITTLSSKDITELANTAFRDTLKTEITGKLKKIIPDVTINNVYFSKYIIQ
ncbi:MAG TPA: flagellar basal body-associated FliL family protein [Ignavibacteriaceae bacterium]|nr:flagellar basal body-associated FliL family protein [Ignavibacteriaceae bacterium]